ncbi:MAG: putative bifunctional diguanylate cyclase/phosphodiesterase [Acidimicrobiales bacterium]
MPPDANAGPPEHRLLDRLASLELVGRAAVGCNAATGLVEAAGVVLDAVCDITGWPVGLLWLVDDDARPSPVPTVVWTAAGPPARQWRGSAQARRDAAAGRRGWDHGSLALPVQLDTGVAALVEFLTDDRRPPDEDLLEVMGRVADQLARVMERERPSVAERERTHVAEPERAPTVRPSSVTGRDPLTGLADRSDFHARLDAALARVPPPGAAVTVLYCDLDRFRSVNDGYGHAVGDRVMAALADRLGRHLPPGATVARMGSDEFAVLVEGVGGGEVDALARRMQEAFATPFAVGAVELWVTASIGVAVAIGEAVSDVVLREASTALDWAKRRGRGRMVVFDEDMRAAAPWSTVTEHELREAVTAGQLRIRYQPIVDLSGGELVGVEALVRWQHPSLGQLRPADFIPLAEASGLVVPLGAWVLGTACRQAQEWQQSAGGHRPLMLTVNVSAQQFAEKTWVPEVAASLAEAGFPAERLVLEITESALMDDTEASARTLGDLRALGVRLAIDDFGTGYSSLAYLRRMPVDFLKIDKAFVDGVTGDAHESALARALVKLAATLGLTAIAEGIERAEQARVLAAVGCDLGQGMWLGPPEPPEAITSRLA